jgi:hypothetical protein
MHYLGNEVLINKAYFKGLGYIYFKQELEWTSGWQYSAGFW